MIVLRWRITDGGAKSFTIGDNRWLFLRNSELAKIADHFAPNYNHYSYSTPLANISVRRFIFVWRVRRIELAMYHH